MVVEYKLFSDIVKSVFPRTLPGVKHNKQTDAVLDVYLDRSIESTER